MNCTSGKVVKRTKGDQFAYSFHPLGVLNHIVYMELELATLEFDFLKLEAMEREFGMHNTTTIIRSIGKVKPSVRYKLPTGEAMVSIAFDLPKDIPSHVRIRAIAGVTTVSTRNVKIRKTQINPFPAQDKCPVCFDEIEDYCTGTEMDWSKLREHVVLSCRHIVCIGCAVMLKKHVNAKCYNERIECPLCRDVTEIPIMLK